MTLALEMVKSGDGDSIFKFIGVSNEYPYYVWLNEDRTLVNFRVTVELQWLEH